MEDPPRLSGLLGGTKYSGEARKKTSVDSLESLSIKIREELSDRGEKGEGVYYHELKIGRVRGRVGNKEKRL